ncbi:hypothetical protein GJ744_006025 [Endocarpon pusillum]|uniref:Uncharacterized protein n=1 Tax=Endocarpon pusillum TaxID=364733 RepID=A0A8H7A7E2_9EURO|nr:hypothetical protein GJ744_006025 [Endocarpon pusillum]
MPSAKVDFFWDWDFVNVTVTRSQGAPKITPAWKGGKAIPKLPPKPKALPSSSTPRPPVRPSINTTRSQKSSDSNTPRITDVTDTEDIPKSEGTKPTATSSASKSTSGNTKKNTPKLKETGAAKAKASSNAPTTSKAVKGTSKPQVNGTR